jgi:Predicted ATPase with chaperone activity
VGEIRQFCNLPDEGQSLMPAAMFQLNPSARAYHRTHDCRFGWYDKIQSVHLAEALQDRPKLMIG